MGRINNLLSLLPSLWPSFSFFLLLFITNFSLLIASPNTTTTSATPFAPPPHEQLDKSKGSPFRPSIAVIIGVLTTVFSVTFLLLLYAKHCRRGGGNNPFSRGYPPINSTNARKNSGIDRAVIESLPIFRFASLRGQKDGLECAVCLNRFEPTEVLKLLPKCKHGFHVECVDTWLDAHSTCPLCRYRVDPEDILLVADNNNNNNNNSTAAPPPPPDIGSSSSINNARVSGRHSFAGNSLEVIVETPKDDGDSKTTMFKARRSLDSWNNSKNNNSRKKRSSEKTAVADVGCFDRPRRKDELLLSGEGTAEHRRLEHRIIISGGNDKEEAEASSDGSLNHRWSDVQPSDLLFLRSEMILGDSRRFSGSRGSRPWISSNSNNGGGGGRNVINTRSVSEITGMSRFSSNEEDQLHQDQQRQQRQEQQRKRQVGAVSRWMAWISQSQSQNQKPAVHRTTSSSSSAVVV